MRHNSRYTTEIIIESDHVDIQFSSYSRYPRALHDNGEFCIFVEGSIYNKSKPQVGSELTQLGRFLMSSKEPPESRAENWILENDGEYIAVLFEKATGGLAILSDALGRLPLYYQSLPTGEMLLAREPKYVVSAASNSHLDRIGIGQFLMFGYNLGTRTMSDGLSRVEPATLIRFLPEAMTPEIRRVRHWFVGSEIDSSMQLTQYAESAASLLCEATRNRARVANGVPISMALSGGLDSRAVILALAREKVEFTSHTCVDYDGANANDVAMAERVSDLIGCPWRQFHLSEPTNDEILTIVSNQEGGSVTWMAAALQHYRMLEQYQNDSVIMFTGDGGGNVMYPFLPAVSVNSVEGLLKLTFDTVYYWDVRAVEELLRLKTGDLRQVAEAEFESYPEQSANWKYAHSKFLGRPYRFIMEGEDRTRFYFWMGTPFWSTQLVRELLRVPESFKSNYRLFRAMLRQLNPESTRIPYSATLINVPFHLLPLYARGNSMIKSHPRLYRYLRTLLVRNKAPNFSQPGLEHTLRKVINTSPTVAEYFDIDSLRRVFDGGLPRMNYHLLTTVLLRIRLLDQDATNC